LEVQTGGQRSSVAHSSGRRGWADAWLCCPSELTRQATIGSNSDNKQEVNSLDSKAASMQVTIRHLMTLAECCHPSSVNFSSASLSSAPLILFEIQMDRDRQIPDSSAIALGFVTGFQPNKHGAGMFNLSNP
jgi:hypothetical protein